jgi:hypothetical protein
LLRSKLTCLPLYTLLVESRTCTNAMAIRTGQVRCPPAPAWWL